MQIYLGNIKEAVKRGPTLASPAPAPTPASLALVQLFDGSLEAAGNSQEAVDAGSVSSTVFAIYGRR
ncbi:MAG: hypothetical protein R2932_41570 [Caldilineaceae bacterium]